MQDETNLTDDDDDDYDVEKEEDYMHYTGTSNNDSKYLTQRFKSNNNIQIPISCNNEHTMTNSSKCCSVCQNAKWPGG
jgi:hypothetical protein